MTKKDYVAIAKNIKVQLDDEPRPNQRDGMIMIIEVLTDFMRSDNPNFNQEKFLKACGF